MSQTSVAPSIVGTSTEVPRSFHGWIVVLVILSVLGVAAGLYMNRYGVDVEPDSAVYITAGVRLAHGEGISLPNLIGAPKPLTWFPPVTPGMVAICEWSGLDIRKSFGVFNALSWGVLIGWVGLLARRGAGGRWMPGLLAAGAILTSRAICMVNGFLYSEPPFLLCLMGALSALAFWWERPRLRWAAVAGGCVGLGLLTRYVGLTLVMLGAMGLLVRPGIDWRRRVATLTLFGVLSVGPMTGWHFWQKIARSAATAERTLAWHPIGLKQINEGIATLASFIVPESCADSLWATRTIVELIAAATGIALWRWLGRDDGKTPREKLAATPALVGISASFITIYLGFLVVSISVADADTPLDWRILSVIVPPGAIIAAYLAFVAEGKQDDRWTRWLIGWGTAALLANLGYSTLMAQVNRDTVSCMPGETSEVLTALRAIPADEIVYSTAPCEVYMVEHRTTEGLPLLPPEDGSDWREEKRYKEEIASMRKTLATRGGWVVYWKGLDGDPTISQETLRTVLPVIEAKTFGDGALLRIGPEL